MLPPVRRLEIGVEDGAFRAVLETIPDAVALVEQSGRIAAINRELEEMFGRAEEDLLGEPVEILIPQRFREDHPRYVEHYFADPDIVHGSNRFHDGAPVEIFGVRENGEEFPVEISVGPLETPGGRFALTVIRDVTEKRRLEDKLRDYNETLEHEVRQRTRELQDKQAELIQSAKMAALGDLAAGVVHDMNTPLGALRSANHSAGLVARRLIAAESGAAPARGPSPVKLARTLEELAATGEQAIAALSEKVRSLRVFSRLDAGPDSDGDLVAGLRSALVLLEPRIRGRIEVIERVEPLPEIRGKHADLNQALMSVLTNAVEAISGQGRIEVVTRREGDAAVIEVSDDGCGIPDDVLPHIFDPGFTTKGVRGVGSGLGLAIARRVLEEHGGGVTASSRPGEGTTVRMSVPFQGP